MSALQRGYRSHAPYRVAIVALGLGATALSAPAQAALDEAYPIRPIALIVPFSPGGVADTLARVVGEKLELSLGQPVLIENKVGAGGSIATEAVAKAAPDGYTLLIAGPGITILPSIRVHAIDPTVAFAPVTKLVTQPILIAANVSLPAHDLGELVAYARRAPQRLAYATAGVGTTDHLAAALLWGRANVDALHVPYASSAQETRDLVQGEVQVAFITIGAVRPLLNRGQLKAVAVTSRRRAATLPDVPTIAESGFPGFDISSWFGLLAPAGTPAAVVARLQREVVRILALPEVGDRLAPLGAEPVGSTPDEFADDIKVQLKLWPSIVNAAGIPRE